MLQINLLNSYLSISTKKKGKKKFNNIGGFGSITNIPKNIKNLKLLLAQMELEQKLKSQI